MIRHLIFSIALIFPSMPSFAKTVVEKGIPSANIHGFLNADMFKSLGFPQGGVIE